MRNVFDQYSQPENRLTHALACTLDNEPRLIRPFLKWLKIGTIPRVQALRLVEQQIPGVNVSGEEGEAKGLPDACLFTSDGWALLFESKVQSRISKNQLDRHLRTAARHGYEDAIIVVIAVNRAFHDIPDRGQVVEWREVYRWFRGRAAKSRWARMFVEYMQVLESQMIANEYLKQGTLTMFDGLCFDEENPYTHREGKRLIRLLRDELRRRRDLHELGVDPTGAGRSAITGHGFDGVWDYLPLKQARGAVQHTAFPHLTLYMNSESAVAAMTVPNGVKGGFRTKLERVGIEGFRSLVATLELGLRPTVLKSKGAKPFLYVTQRHFRSQRSAGIKDGRVDVDLRTLAGCSKEGIKCQPEWIDAIYNLLVCKRSNIQFGADVHFKYNCPIVRSRGVIDLCADTWVSQKPLLDFVLGAE